MTCEINSTIGSIAGSFGMGAAIGALTSTFPWVAVSVSTATLAWVGAVGSGCGAIAGLGATAILSCCGLNKTLADVIGGIIGFATQLILTAGILISTGMAAGTAFTIAASTLIVPMAILGAILIGYIACGICCCCASSAGLLPQE